MPTFISVIDLLFQLQTFFIAGQRVAKESYNQFIKIRQNVKGVRGDYRGVLIKEATNANNHFQK